MTENRRIFVVEQILHYNLKYYVLTDFKRDINLIFFNNTKKSIIQYKQMYMV